MPDREVKTLKSWFSQHLNIQQISRDRYSRFREVIDEILPHSIQVNDRFHLVHNLWNLLDQVTQKILPLRIQKNSSKDEDLSQRKTPPHSMTQAEQKRQKTMERKWERALQVKALKKDGYTKQAIAQILQIDPRTVTADLQREQPEYVTRKTSPLPVEKWKDQIKELEAAGHTVRMIYQIIKEHGFYGTFGSVRMHIEKLRKERKQGIPHKAPTYYSRREIRRILWQAKSISDKERMTLNEMLQRFPKLQPFFAFLQGFREVISNLDGEGLRELVLYEKARQDPLTKKFIERLMIDLPSVMHACKLKESNGFVEGHVNRLKTIKRMMYGRASFELLRIRVLHYGTTIKK